MRSAPVLFISLAFTTALFSATWIDAAEKNVADSVRLEQSFGRLPLYFIENRGQMDKDVAFYVRGSDKTLYFTPRGISFTLTGQEGGEKRRWSVKLDFLGADPNVEVKGQEKQEAIFSYFKGKPEEWNAGIPTYAELVYSELWPGIDLVYSGTANKLKYEFIVKPGADPGKIRLAYRGAEGVDLGETGELEVTTPVGGFEDGKPYAYQVLDGKQVEVSMRYALEDDSPEGTFAYGFDLGAYDADKSLILDPVLLVYCGYIGGQENDKAFDVALDGDGNLYVVGRTQSTESSFPVKVGPDLTFNSDPLTIFEDAFVAKVNAQGTDLDYCGYIGGEKSEYGIGIAVDGHGNAYVTGMTFSTETSFPVKVGPDLTYNSTYYPGKPWDAFVAKVNAKGDSLVYCGYIGGQDNDKAWDIAVDGHGNAFVTGSTESDASSFPVKVGPYLTKGQWAEAFVAKVNTQGTGLDYCGYIGGDGNTGAYRIAVDGHGSAYVTGLTGSDESSFPVKVGPDLTYNGGTDTFVAKVNTQGIGLDYCGYIGGGDDDCGYGIAVDGDFNAYVTGATQSDESSFPVKAGPMLTYSGGYGGDAFVAKVNAQGTGLDYCGYIGGGDDDGGDGIAVDDDFNAYVAGYTRSDESTFPVKGGPDLTFNSSPLQSLPDAFVAKVNAQGTGLDYCGYIGGESAELSRGIAVDSSGNVYVAGNTTSDESSFPVNKGPALTFSGGINSGDAFVAKVPCMSLVADTYNISESSGGTISFSLISGGDNGNRNYMLLGGMTGTEPGIPLPGGLVSLPLNWDPFTNLVFTLMNSPFFSDFQGKLDGSGNGAAQFNTMGPLPPGFTGLSLYFAYALNAPWDFVSNPVSIVIEP